MQHRHRQHQCDDDLQLNYRRREIDAGELAGAVVAVAPADKVQEPDDGKPGDRLRRERRQAGDGSAQDRERQEADDAQRDRHRHALDRRAGDDAAPRGGVVEREGRGRQHGQHGPEHLRPPLKPGRMPPRPAED